MAIRYHGGEAYTGSSCLLNKMALIARARRSRTAQSLGDEIIVGKQ